MAVLSCDRDEPDCSDYTLNEGSCWITVGRFSVYIRQAAEGVFVDIFPRGQEAEPPIADTCAYFSEAG